MTAQGLLVFDVDSTFIEEEVIELLADATGRRGEVAAVTERAMRGELDFAQSLRERVAVLTDLPDTVLADAAAAVTLTPGAAEVVAAARADGWIVPSCPVVSPQSSSGSSTGPSTAASRAAPSSASPRGS